MILIKCNINLSFKNNKPFSPSPGGEGVSGVRYFGEGG